MVKLFLLKGHFTDMVGPHLARLTELYPAAVSDTGTQRGVNPSPHPLPRCAMKNLAEIFATKLTLSEDVQVGFDARRRTDPADTVRGRFFLFLDEGPPVVLGEVVYAVAFLTRAHDYVRTAYLKEDAEKLLNRLAEEASDL